MKKVTKSRPQTLPLLPSKNKYPLNPSLGLSGSVHALLAKMCFICSKKTPDALSASFTDVCLFVCIIGKLSFGPLFMYKNFFPRLGYFSGTHETQQRKAFTFMFACSHIYVLIHTCIYISLYNKMRYSTLCVFYLNYSCNFFLNVHFDIVFELYTSVHGSVRF